MKVYIVGDEDYEGLDIHGVFSTEEKALFSLPYLTNGTPETSLFEFDLDQEPTGERHELYYFYSITFEGEEGDDFTFQIRMLPSQVKAFEYGDHYRPHTSAYCGSGRTLEEAKNNAYKARELGNPVWQVCFSGENYYHSDISHVYKHDSRMPYAVHADKNVCIIAIQEYKKGGTRFSEFLTFSPK